MTNEKLQAISNRVNKFTSRINKTENAIYYGAESLLRLKVIADDIILALERSLPEDEWIAFEDNFRDALYILSDDYKDKELKKYVFNTARNMLVHSLQLFLDHINKWNQSAS